MRPALEVLQPGLLTTVQDLGRVGFQHTGMVAAGAMDAFSLQVANCLVGNRRGAAGLEMTMTGPELKALEDLVIALCGADLGATVDGVPSRCGKVLCWSGGASSVFGDPEGAYAPIWRWPAGYAGRM